VPGKLCETEVPPVRRMDDGHFVKCHLADDIFGAMEPVISFEAKEEEPAPQKPAAAKAEARPPEMRKPATPDDLKLISGVGPKIEGILNGLGIYKYEQIAKWTEAEREWVDDHLKFKGRIEREDWARQATALAEGGVDEYVRVFGKKPR
jgi:peptide/nickel transport system ATP-binding protein